MRNLKDYIGFINEAVQASETTRFIADLIQKSVGGLGTDEELLSNAISSIPNLQTLIKINQIMSTDPKFSYKTVGDAINGELGFMDGHFKAEITGHINKIGGSKYLKSITSPVPTADQILKSIIPRIKQHEGVKPKKYLDTKGIPTVGIGFNLNRSDADAKLKSVGANPIKVKQGKQSLTVPQMETLLVADLKDAMKSAGTLLPGFTSYPPQVQGVLIEMVFNMGKKKVLEFNDFIANLRSKNYEEASAEMLKSKWSKQVGQRAKTLANLVATA